MALSGKIIEFKEKLRRGEYVSEAAVSNGIVLPVFHELGWPVFDTSVVVPEFTVGGGRVDYALCHPANKPAVFVEVKKDLRNSQGGDRQLFEYAFHVGAPMTVLTDGQEWSFYLPAEQGHYDERRVYKLDLLERDTAQAVSVLERYLQYSYVCSGKALESAREDYRKEARKRDVQRTLPQAWRALLEEPDSLLVELLSEKVEDLCGYQPNLELCSDFLGDQAARLRETGSTSKGFPAHRTSTKDRPRPAPPQTTRYPQTRTRRTGQYALIYKGTTYAATSASDVMAQLFQVLARDDGTFLERFCARKHGRKRRYVARDPQELYPGRPDLAEKASVQFVDGWWLGTNYSRGNMKIIIQLACEVAGLEYGQDVKVELD